MSSLTFLTMLRFPFDWTQEKRYLLKRKKGLVSHIEKVPLGPDMDRRGLARIINRGLGSEFFDEGYICNVYLSDYANIVLEGSKTQVKFKVNIYGRNESIELEFFSRSSS